MALIIATDVNTNIADGYTLASGDTLFVQVPINVYATGPTYSGVVGPGDMKVDARGTIIGNQFGISFGTGVGGSVYVGQDGSIGAGGGTADHPTEAAILFNQTFGFGVLNQGLISSPTSAVKITNGVGLIDNDGTIAGLKGIELIGGFGANLFFSLQNREHGEIFGDYDGSQSFYQENIVNLGTMYGNVTMGGGDFDLLENHNVISGTVTLGGGLGSGHNAQVMNFGKIGGGLVMGDGVNTRVVNADEIFGPVTMGNGPGQVFDSTLGTVFNSSGNTITGGSMNDTIVGALNGGIILGNGGDDTIIANQTDTAPAVYHAKTTMDGGAGTNALYGGGGLNVFWSGDATYNQIWGGVSQLAEHSGYYNNTVDYHLANAGVYVDLLAGHNAYVSTIAGANWTGLTSRFEDSIANVPNVVGSNFGDLIQAGATHGDVWGGLGADQLFAGVGPDAGTEFVYNGAADSNLVSGYDTIVGFKIGTDQINLAAFSTDASHVLIQTSGTSNTVYWEKTAGTFNANTDLALVVNATTAAGLTTADFVF